MKRTPSISVESRVGIEAMRITARLGIGGEATVWKGRLKIDGRWVAVALKFVHAHASPERLDGAVAAAAGAPVRCTRLRGPRPLTARAISHSQLAQFQLHASLLRDEVGVAGFVDYGLLRVRTAGGDFEDAAYLATRLVQPLAADHPRHPSRDVEAALRCAREVAETLEGLSTRRNGPKLETHGDLTPANVLIDRRGRAIIIDFGAAVAVDPKGVAARVGGGGIPADSVEGQRLPRPATPWLPPERTGLLRSISAQEETRWRAAWDTYGVGMLLAEWSLRPRIVQQLRTAGSATADGQSSARSMHADRLLIEVARAILERCPNLPLASAVSLAEFLGAMLLAEVSQRPTLGEIRDRLDAILATWTQTRRRTSGGPESLSEAPRMPLLWNRVRDALDYGRRDFRSRLADPLDLARVHDGSAEWDGVLQAIDNALGPREERARLRDYIGRELDAWAVERGHAKSSRTPQVTAAIRFGAAVLGITAPRAGSAPDVRRGLVALTGRSRVRTYRKLEALLAWQLASNGLDAPASQDPLQGLLVRVLGRPPASRAGVDGGRRVAQSARQRGSRAAGG